MYPLDQKLGLRPGQMSAELESLSGMTGAQLSFDQGSKLFEALTLISLSDHSLAKATQAMGSEVIGNRIIILRRQRLAAGQTHQGIAVNGYKRDPAFQHFLDQKANRPRATSPSISGGTAFRPRRSRPRSAGARPGRRSSRKPSPKAPIY